MSPKVGFSGLAADEVPAAATARKAGRRLSFASVPDSGDPLLRRRVDIHPAGPGRGLPASWPGLRIDFSEASDPFAGCDGLIMVVYDLLCSRGHQFEGWFQNLEDLEIQLADHRLTCPVCNNENISRLPSTFSLVKAGRGEAVAEPSGGGQPEAVTRLQEVMRRWNEISERLEKDFDDVGSDFASEALKMHYGASDRRNIKGLSTESQEEMLHREGVEFFKLPMLRKPPHSTEN